MVVEFLKVLMAIRSKKSDAKDKAVESKTAAKSIASESSPRKTSAKSKTATDSCACQVEVSRVSSLNKGLDHAAIAHRAWEIWQHEGCPEGRDMEHWLQAEKELGA